MKDIEEFFLTKIKVLEKYNSEECRSYILGVLIKPNCDLVARPLTLVYAEASLGGKFELFQKLGDWILTAEIMFPESLNYASEEYYYSLAQSSFWKCFIIMNKQWEVYEELAKTFPSMMKILKNEKLNQD